MHSVNNSCFKDKCGKDKWWSEELVFEKFLSVKSIFHQIFTHFEFWYVFLTDQIFMIRLFHLESRDPKPHPVENLSMEFPH